MIAAIGRVEQLLVRADGDELCRRRARIDADINCAAIVRETAAFHAVTVMPRTERRIVLRALEQREVRRARLRCRSLLRTRNARLHLPHIGCSGIVGERRANRDKIIAIIHIDNVFVIELQCLDKAFFQFREEVQRSAEEGNIAADRTPLREVADGLVDDRLKDGKCDIRLCCTVVHERLHVRLREYAAARGNRIDALALLRECIQPEWVSREQRRHVVDKRARTARADAVHTLLGGIAEIRDLGILAAELDRRRRLRNEAAHGGGAGNNLLHKRQSDALGNAHARRARERKREFRLAHHVPQLRQILLQRLADLGKMACIVLVEDLMLLSEHNQLNRCRPDIHPDTKWGFQNNTTYPNPYEIIRTLFISHILNRKAF